MSWYGVLLMKAWKKILVIENCLLYFKKYSHWNPQQLFTVKDFVSAYLLKTDLQNNLAVK